MKKRNELFKAIMICFAVYALLSWLIPAGTISNGAVTAGDKTPVGLFGLFYYPILTIATFVQFGCVALCLGAFYGVLNKTGVYTKLVSDIAKKFEGKEKRFLIGTIVLFIVLSSVIGVPYALLVFIPLFVGILMTLGYTNITAVAATIGSTIVGTAASTYGLSGGTQIANVLSIDINDNILLKFGFLVVVTLLYIFFIVSKKSSTIEKKAVKPSKKGKKAVAEDKEEAKLVIPFLEEEEKSNKKAKPLLIMLVFFAIVLFLSMTNWKYMFKFEGFEDFYNKLGDIKLFGISMVNALGLTNPFGYWTSFELSSLLIIFALLIGWIYGLGFDNTLDGMKTGAQRMFKTAFLMMIGSVVFTMMLSGGTSTIFVTMAGKLVGLTKGFNFLTTGFTALLSGFFYNDFYYALSSVSTLFSGKFDAEYMPIVGFLFQTIHSLVMLVIPTSLILLAGLSMFNVSLKDWFKYIIKFVLELLVISLVISVILILVV